MQALFSYDQAPPIGAPFRFFLTAPLFGILAGLLVLWGGADALASRWTPAVLALTHLIAVGFMLQVMLGAMIQILPVVAGANMARPMLVAGIVHVALNTGTLLLVSAFLTFSPFLFKSAAVFFGGGIALFVFSAARALHGVPSTSPTIGGLKLSLAGLAVTIALGVTLAVSLGWSLELPLMQWADIHLGWGFVGWGTALLAAVGYVVVPMFQITPAYPVWFTRGFSVLLLGVVAFWTIVELSGAGLAAFLSSVLVVGVAALFAAVTLKIQRQSKRARFDANQHCWRVAMLSALAACIVWLAAQSIPAIGERPEWPVVCGVFILLGGFMSVIVGMLYKIVPFLVWLHLQNQGQGRVMAPNMNKIIAGQAMDRQMMMHFASCALVLLAVFWPDGFVYPAGVALVVANGWLLRNLLTALSVYRSHQLKIDLALDH